MSSTSSDITYLVTEKFSHVIHGILNAVNVVRHYKVLGDGKFKSMSGSSPGVDLSSICHHTTAAVYYITSYILLVVLMNTTVRIHFI